MCVAAGRDSSRGTWAGATSSDAGTALRPAASPLRKSRTRSTSVAEDDTAGSSSKSTSDRARLSHVGSRPGVYTMRPLGHSRVMLPPSGSCRHAARSESKAGRTGVSLPSRQLRQWRFASPSASSSLLTFARMIATRPPVHGLLGSCAASLVRDDRGLCDPYAVGAAERARSDNRMLSTSTRPSCHPWSRGSERLRWPRRTHFQTRESWRSRPNGVRVIGSQSLADADRLTRQ